MTGNVRSIADIAMELRPMQKTTGIERKILVWGRAFKSLKDIPEWISISQMKKAYDVFRIEMHTITFAFGVLVFLGAALSEHKKHVVHIHQADPQWRK
jgi:hypothetical protein